MGASGSTELQIKFSRPNLFYYTGEQVSGNISFQNTQEKITLDGVFMEFIGEMGYITQETRQLPDNNGNSRTENYTKTNIIPFINIRIPVVQPQYGQREITLYRGEHSWPFEFILPQNLPSTLLPATISYPYVKYYTRVVLDKPYKPNPKQVYPLTIFPRVNLLYTPGGQQPVAFQNQNRKKIRLHGYLVRGGVVPGDRIFVQVDIQNPKQTTIKRIEATLIQHRHIGQSHHAETIFRVDLPDIRDFMNANLQRTFELMVPAGYLSPSHTYLTQSMVPPIAIGVHYELTLDVKVRGLFTDFKVTVPVIFCTEPMSAEQQQQQQMNPPPPPSSIEMPIPSAPVLEYDDLPPSYESIVTDQKI